MVLDFERSGTSLFSRGCSDQVSACWVNVILCGALHYTQEQVNTLLFWFYLSSAVDLYTKQKSSKSPSTSEASTVSYILASLKIMVLKIDND